jgi:hypothetical protein
MADRREQMSSETNKTQVGGTHYTTKTGLQHWDLMAAHGVGYLEGQASRYVFRWRKKNGIEDLQKARHFLLKIIEVHLRQKVKETPRVPLENTVLFVQANRMHAVDGAIFSMILTWQSLQDVQRCIEQIDKLLATAETERQLAHATTQQPGAI